MNRVKGYIYDKIDQQGYILAYNLSREAHNELLTLIVKKKLISLAKIKDTENYMSANCMYTYADNRYKLKITHDIIGNSFISRGASKTKKQK